MLRPRSRKINENLAKKARSPRKGRMKSGGGEAGAAMLPLGRSQVPPAALKVTLSLSSKPTA